MQWFRFYSAGFLNDYRVQSLKPREFRRQMEACMAGETNVFSRYIKPGWDRLPRHLWEPLRALVFERDDYTCQYCGDRGGKLECDHVVPVSRGGSDETDNLRAACRSCNRNKRDKTLEEWSAGAVG